MCTSNGCPKPRRPSATIQFGSSTPCRLSRRWNKPDPSDYRVGNLPDDSSTRSYTWAILAGIGWRADIGPAGFGHTQFMRTAPSSAPGNLGSSSIVLSYCYRWMDTTGQINEFCVLPRVVSATPVSTPVYMRSPAAYYALRRSYSQLERKWKMKNLIYLCCWFSCCASAPE